MEEETPIETVVIPEDEPSDVETGEDFAEASGSGADTVETVYIAVPEERPFMTTALDDYSVTEGLLLLIFMVLLFRSAFGLIARWF